MHSLSPYSGPPSIRASLRSGAYWLCAACTAAAEGMRRVVTVWPLACAVGLLRAAAAERRARLAADALKSWDDHRLRDIGLERMHIDAAVRGEYVPGDSDGTATRQRP